MSSKNSVGNNPAFPVADISKTQCPGMTYRQWLIGTIASGMAGLTHEQCKVQAIMKADLIIAQLDKEANFPH